MNACFTYKQYQVVFSSACNLQTLLSEPLLQYTNIYLTVITISDAILQSVMKLYSGFSSQKNKKTSWAQLVAHCDA